MIFILPHCSVLEDLKERIGEASRTSITFYSQLYDFMLYFRLGAIALIMIIIK